MAADQTEEVYKLLKRLHYENETGQLVVPELGDVLIFLSLSFRNMIRWTAAKFGAGSTMIWYNIGKAAASGMVEAFKRVKSSAGGDDFVRLLDAYTTTIGWGEVHTTRFNFQDRTAVIRIKNSALTRGIDRGYGCDFIRGYLSGIYDAILATRTFCEEVLCESKGARYCEFHLRGQ